MRKIHKGLAWAGSCHPARPKKRRNMLTLRGELSLSLSLYLPASGDGGLSTLQPGLRPRGSNSSKGFFQEARGSISSRPLRFSGLWVSYSLRGDLPPPCGLRVWGSPPPSRSPWMGDPLINMQASFSKRPALTSLFAASLGRFGHTKKKTLCCSFILCSSLLFL